jgi:hypothetical protein
MLDRRKICDFNLRSMETDKARDGIHSGPRTNERFARALFRLFVKTQQSRGRKR